MSPAQISDVVRTLQTSRQDAAAAASTLRSPESLASQTKRQLSIAFHDVLRVQLIPKTWAFLRQKVLLPEQTPRRHTSDRRTRNRHRGESRLSSPATPPYMRVRIRRF